MATINITLMDLNETPYFDKESRQDVETARTYRESRTNAVIQLAAIEPDGHDLQWEVTGSDASDFEVVDAEDLGDGKDRQHLMFKSQPDYETPKGKGVDGNMYEVTVRATEMTAVGGGPKKSTELDVMVQVENVNERGMVELNWLQPEVGTEIIATVIDPDTDGEVENANAQTEAAYTWYRSKVGNPNRNPGTSEADLAGEWEEITSDPSQTGAAEQCSGDDNANNNVYTPQGDCAESDDDEPTMDDEGRYLLVRAVYRDNSAVGDDGTTADVNATTTAIGISAYKVQADVSNDANYSPDFRSSTASRTVPEDTAKGMPVGAPVDVDRNEDGDILTYEIVMSASGDDGNRDVVERTDAPNDAEFFSIDKATGQLRVAMPLTAEMEDKRTYTGEDPAMPGKYVVVLRATDPSGEPDDENRDDIVVTVTATDVNEAPRVTGMAELAVNEADSSNKDFYRGLEYRLNPDNSGEYLQPDDSTTPYAGAFNDDGDEETASTTGDNLFKRVENDAVDRAIWPEPIGGADGALFEYSIPEDGIGRRLHFISVPDFEDPKDADGDNVYEVTIMVEDSAGAAGEKAIRITVFNVDEKGKLVLTPEQPDDGMPVIATLTDPDGVVNVTDWTWAATSTSVSAFQMGDVIDNSTIHRYMGSSYTGDAGEFVWAMVDYRDGASVENDPVTRPRRTE